MTTYLVRRLLWTFVSLFLVCLVTFMLMHAVPGGPFEVRTGERGVSPEFVRAAEAYYGHDDPLPEQFVRMLGNLLRGDLGLSYAYQGQPVTGLLLDRAKPSLLLGVMAFLLVVGVGLPSGVLAAIRRNGAWDVVALGVSTLLVAIPNFVMAFLLLLVFSVGLGWMDVRPGQGFGESLPSLLNGIVPAFALGAPAMALLSRMTRSVMIEVLDQDYIRTARAKGLAPRTVYVRHALRNALIPILTLLGPVLAGLITGSIIIEAIFGLPGIGAAFVISVGQRDYGMIMGSTLLYAAIIMLANLWVDLLYPFVDPRVAR